MTTSLASTAWGFRILGFWLLMSIPSSRMASDDDRIDGVDWGRSSGTDFDGLTSQMANKAGGHLGTTGVVYADEQDAGFIDHYVLCG